MFSKIKKFIYFIIFYSGFVYLIRLIYRKIFDNPIRILYTHRVIDKSDEPFPLLKCLDYFTVKEFEKKIQYLLKNYRFISFDECLEYLRSGKERPQDCVVLTFDDGYKCIYTKVFPILKKYNIPATVFITTNAINNGIILWFDRLLYSIEKTQVKEFSLPKISNRIYKLNSINDKKNAYEDIVTRLKKVENDEKEKILEEMAEILKINKSEIKNKDTMLTWEEIKEMRVSGLISFGSHTMSHPILTRISLATAKVEISQSKKIIEENIRVPIKFFSYPNGDFEDFNEEIKAIVKSSKYLCACTTINDNRNGDLFILRRDGFINEPFYMFGLRMAGLFNLIKFFQKKSN